MPIQARRFPHRRGDTVPGAEAQRRNCLLHQVIGVPCQKVMARLYPARITDSLARLHSIRTGSSMARMLPARITDSLARLHSIRTLSSMARMLPIHTNGSMAPHRLDDPQVSDSQNRLIGQIASHFHYIHKFPPNTVNFRLPARWTRTGSMARLYPTRITDSLARRQSIRTGSSMTRMLPAPITDSLARLHCIRTLSSMARMLPHPHKRLDGPTPTRCPSSFRCAEPTNWPDCFPLPLHTQGAAEHSELQENQQTQTSNIITNTSSATQR